ncbi:hypothetical protein OG244_17265 [Streptomyces brevispora]|uniref:hypothetical protein n=1 Tax=Streptomyces brevispora TaxID=887462 RepID=UPI002E36CA1E|nr:hypothetical protein [Streptomyces brevispora]
MIDLGKIPTFTGNLESLETHAASLKATASNIRGTGKDVHTAFQALDAVYDAPEQEELLNSTLPVRDKADAFAEKLESVSGALTGFASTARPLVNRMNQLRADAAKFVADNKDDDDWQQDQDKIDENSRLVHEVGTTWVAFQGAERDAANQITALVGGTHFVVDDGSHKAGMHGFKESDVKDAEETPWGTVDKREYTGLRAAWEWTKDNVGGALKGFFVDGVWGTIKGLCSMVNIFDWDNFKKTWSSIGDVFGGVSAYLMTPYDWAMDKMFGPADHSDTDKQKAALRNFGKSLVAWDEWDKDPSRALGTVLFNGVTFGSGSLLKLGKAGKLGVGAEAVTALGRAGVLVDPMSYLGKAAGVTKLKVGDFMESLKAGRAGVDDMARNMPTGASPHPGEAPATPGLEYIDRNGNTRVIGDDSIIRDEHGNAAPDTEPVKEPHKSDLSNTHETTPTPVKEKVLEGAGGPGRMENGAGHPSGSTAHPGDGSHPVGGGGGTHNPPSTGGHATDHPTGGGSGSGAGSHPPSGGGGSHTPGGGSGGSHTPTGGGGHDTGGPSDATGTSAGGHSGSAHSGDGSHGSEAGDGNPASGGETQEHGRTQTSDTSGETDATPGDRPNEPLPELTAEERAGQWGHLEEVEKRAPEEFDELKHDPDHRGKITNDSMDEARVGLDLREQGRLPADIHRPEVADMGEFYSETTGKYYDIKGVHSFWPPFNNVRNPDLLARPFPGAYNPSRHAQTWVNTFTEQIVENQRVVVVDIRNANQAAIDSIKDIVESHGWGDNVIWYP